jgi:hypothetical protein
MGNTRIRMGPGVFYEMINRSVRGNPEASLPPFGPV